jgi:hypothetical protein
MSTQADGLTAILGHEICSHTWSHTALTTLTNEQIIAEIRWTEKIIREVTGVTPRYLRPPYGDVDDRVRAVVEAAGYRILHWNLDSFDWQTTGSTSDILRNVQAKLSGSSSGFVLLGHDGRSDLANGWAGALGSLIKYGYPMGTVSQCLQNAPGSEPKESPTKTTNPPTGTTNPPAETTNPPAETTKPPAETTKPPTETGNPSTETGKPSTETGKPSTETGKPSEGSPNETEGPRSETSDEESEDESSAAPSKMMLGILHFLLWIPCLIILLSTLI